MRQRTSCALCGSGHGLRTVYAQTLQHRPPFSDFVAAGEFPVVIHGRVCVRCGWVFKAEVFEDDELARLYSPNSGESPGRRETGGGGATARHRSEAMHRFVEPHLGPGAKRILDVGGRGGELMGAFVDAGHEVTAVDLGAQQRAAFPQVKVVQASFLGWKSGPCDLVIMSHVLEHTDDPGAFLGHAHAILGEGGLVFAEVPFELLTPLLVRHVGDHRHLVYFSRLTLRGFLEKSGFDVLRCEHVNDVVGARIPLLRALGRRRAQTRPWSPPPLAVLRSCAEVLRPQAIAVRVGSRLASRSASARA